MTGTGRQGRTPLHHAALADDADTVAMLLAQGADPDAADQIGFTSLHLAAQQRATSAAAVLLSAGARLDAVNSYGNTPLSTPQGRVAAGAGRRPPQQGRDGTEQGH